MPLFEWDASVKNKTRTSRLHQLMFGYKVPARPKHPTTKRTRVINGRRYYIYDGALAKFDENGRRHLLPGVELGWGMVRVSEEMSEKVKKILKQVGVR